MVATRLLVSMGLVVVVAVALAVVFPFESQRILVGVAHKYLTWKHNYILRDVTPQLSAESRALEDMFRIMPKTSTVEELRDAMDKFALFNPLPSSAKVQSVLLRWPDLKGYWVTPAGISESDNQGPVVMYLHGGGYVGGSAAGYLGWTSEIASRVGGRVFFVEYRLAPEAPLPAAIEDAVWAYRWLVNDQKIDPKRIAVMGDSAGGGLTLHTLLTIQEEGEAKVPPPAVAVTFSAWTDLVTSATGQPAYTQNKATDAMFDYAVALEIAIAATGTKPEEYEKRKSPKFSPLYAAKEALANLPPLLMQVSDSEILRDDTLQLYERIKKVNSEVRLEEGKQMQHIYPFFYQWCPECNSALNSAVTFVKAHLGN